MAHLIDIAEPTRSHITALDCPDFDALAWVSGPPLAQRRIAMVSSAGLIRRGDRQFRQSADDYRVVPNDAAEGDVIISHVSVNFDRSGFHQDMNVMFPRDRLNELAAGGAIGSVANEHYSFMGATDPRRMEPHAREAAARMKRDAVDTVLLVPV